MLSPVPAGAEAWTTTWGRTVNPTLTQFVAHVYPADARAAQLKLLQTEGAGPVAHRAWTGPDMSALEILLVQFGTATAAMQRMQLLSSSAGSAVSTVHFAGFTACDVVGFADKQPDSSGARFIRVYACVPARHVVAQAYYSSVSAPNTTLLTQWITGQVRRLEP